VTCSQADSLQAPASNIKMLLPSPQELASGATLADVKQLLGIILPGWLAEFGRLLSKPLDPNVSQGCGGAVLSWCVREQRGRSVGRSLLAVTCVFNPFQFAAVMSSPFFAARRCTNLAVTVACVPP
jgi:hypothetical protein